MLLHLFSASESTIFPNEVSCSGKSTSSKIMSPLHSCLALRKKDIRGATSAGGYQSIISEIGPCKPSAYSVFKLTTRCIRIYGSKSKLPCWLINLGTGLCYLNVETTVSIVPSAQSVVSHHLLKHVNNNRAAKKTR